MKIIARIETDFPEKFGIPRQSGLLETARGVIAFEPAYRNADALKGIEGYDYLWLLWQFEGVERENWSPMVRPPRLGGNEYMGVFATRSPFRPNPIGLSSVKLEEVIWDTDRGPVLIVSGVDMRHNTPICDIKPYLAYTDAHPEAKGGFAGNVLEYKLQVEFPADLLMQIPEDRREEIVRLLEQDPRPSYHNDPERVYGVSYAEWNVKFQVDEDVLRVVGVEKQKRKYKGI